MKVLLINGSPHEKGCTYTALSLIAGELNAAGIETEILNVGTKPGGLSGRIMLWAMNWGHASLAKWGRSHVSPERLPFQRAIYVCPEII